MNSVEKKLHQKLVSRKENNNFRSLSLPLDLIDFTSNDYLGLANSKKLLEQIKETEQPGAPLGATGSRLLSGNSLQYQETEQYLARIFHSESTLIFNSGYNANLGLLSILPGKGDTIVYDELIHTSLKDGARLSPAQHVAFRHNDLGHLETKLKSAKGNIFVVVESIYSMDGDACPLGSLIEVCERHCAAIFLDEAHSTGIMGNNGNGMACSFGLHDRVFARIYTFGKAMGVHGACIAGSSTLIDYLINFSRPFIYSTALPPHSIHAIRQAFVFLGKNEALQQTLNEKIKLFKTLMAEAEITGLVESDSAIQALIIPEKDNATQNNGLKEPHKNQIGDRKYRVKNLAKWMQYKGFDVRPILSPTVREGSERIRICLHVFNSDSDIKKLINLLKEGLEKF